MKPMLYVEYSRLGNDGFVAQIAVMSDRKDEEHDWGDFDDFVIVEEMFSEDWSVLIDRVLFFLSEFDSTKF